MKIKPRILFFKTNKDARFGGYTTQIWPTNNIARDENSFVFSLNKKEKYKVKSPDKAIVGREKYFQFGFLCFRILDKCSSTTNNYIRNKEVIMFQIIMD